MKLWNEQMQETITVLRQRRDYAVRSGLYYFEYRKPIDEKNSLVAKFLVDVNLVGGRVPVHVVRPVPKSDMDEIIAQASHALNQQELERGARALMGLKPEEPVLAETSTES